MFQNSNGIARLFQAPVGNMLKLVVANVSNLMVVARR